MYKLIPSSISQIPSGIRDIDAEPTAKSPDIFYSIDGIQRTAPHKGLIIKNNKKVVR